MERRPPGWTPDERHSNQRSVVPMATNINSITLPPMEALATVAAEMAEQAEQEGNGSLLNAINKAVAELHNGCTPIATVGGFLVESRTRGGVVHRISPALRCS